MLELRGYGKQKFNKPITKIMQEGIREVLKC